MTSARPRAQNSSAILFFQPLILSLLTIGLSGEYSPRQSPTYRIARTCTHENIYFATRGQVAFTRNDGYNRFFPFVAHA
jgi:hypothetical protein